MVKFLFHTATGNLVLLAGVAVGGAVALGTMIRRRIG